LSRTTGKEPIDNRGNILAINFARRWTSYGRLPAPVQ
jgi:hypothetical protein